MQIRVPARLIADAILIGAAAQLGVAIGAQIEEAAGDACKLVTAAQVAAGLGVPVDDGAYSFPGHTQSCVWRESVKSQMLARMSRSTF